MTTAWDMTDPENPYVSDASLNGITVTGGGSITYKGKTYSTSCSIVLDVATTGTITIDDKEFDITDL